MLIRIREQRLLLLIVCLTVPLVEGFAVTPNIRRLLHSNGSLTSSRSRRSNDLQSNFLSMHMGHSHSHHHHDDRPHQEENIRKQLSSGDRKRKQRRKVVSVVFAALATLGVKIVQRRTINKSDLLIFGLTSALCILSDKIRRSLKLTIQKLKSFRDGIIRHSTPPGEWLSSVLGSSTEKENARKAEADQITLFGGLVNLVLSALKLVVGISCHSAALIADAGHSLSDLFSDVITLWAVQVGRLPPDEDHPYGHGKFEAVGSLFLALTLLGTGLSIGTSSNKKLLEIIAIQRAQGINSLLGSAQVPSKPALLVAFVSIVSKEWLYRITRRIGEKINSQVIIANAWHHRTDAYSSVMALFAIALAIYFPSLLAADAAAGVLVAGMISMTGAEILGESIKQLTDTANEQLVRKVRRIAETHSRNDYSDINMEVNRVRARQVGSLALVDLEIGMPGSLSSAESHKISHKLREKLLIDMADSVMDVEVHARSNFEDKTDEIPTLGVIRHEHASEETAISGNRPSDADIESHVRGVIDDSVHSNIIDKVHSVTVKHDFATNQDDFTTNVDVLLSVSYSEDLTVSSVKDMVSTIRKSIENIDNIEKASLFLDLNAPVPASSTKPNV